MKQFDRDLTHDYNIESEQQLKLVGRNLKIFMLQKKINSVELYRELGISTGTISKIVNGKCSPHLLTIYSITQYLEISIDDLFRYPHLLFSDDAPVDKLA